ncbi:hypothetical protein EBZ37_02485, partial [bacterium]|nr:hypothetical protein [bacterium]
MKGAWDLGSEKDIITDKTDIVGELKKYDPVAFEKRRQALIKKYQGYSDVAPEYLQSELKKDPGYKGWRISQLLEKPDLVMVQKKVPIQREFRVEVVAGKVLGNGSTVDRFKYMYEIGADGLKMKDYQAPSSEDFKKVEAFAQQAIDKLPPQLRGMPYGMDIAILEDGKVAMIESNPGGNSNFLFEEDKASVEALGKFLEKYPDAAKSGEIPKAVADGMDPKAQMEYLKKFFSEHGIDPARQYPGVRFLADRLDDPEFKPTRVSPEDYSV